MNQLKDNSVLIPAAGGTETPFKTRNGRTVQYMWDCVNGGHYYLDLSTDMVLSEEDLKWEFM